MAPNRHHICSNCGSELSHDFKYCPNCGKKRRGLLPTKFCPTYGVTAVYSVLLILSVFLGWMGYAVHPTNAQIASVLLSVAVAFGPVSIIGLVYERCLRTALQTAAVSSFSDLSQTVCHSSIEKMDTLRQRLEDQVHQLLHISTVGLVAALPERCLAFARIADAIKLEQHCLYLVGTSLRGLIWDKFGDEGVRNAILNKIRGDGCEVRVLLTHPAFAHLRQALEQIQRKESFHIAQEILETVAMLRDIKFPHEWVRFVRGTPTTFGIMTSELMLLNPYPLQKQAFTSVTFLIDSQNGKNPVYRSWDQSHFSGVWDGDNVDTLRDYSLASIQEVFNKTLESLGLCKSNRQIDYSRYDHSPGHHSPPPETGSGAC